MIRKKKKEVSYRVHQKKNPTTDANIPFAGLVDPFRLYILLDRAVCVDGSDVPPEQLHNLRFVSFIDVSCISNYLYV